MSIALKAENVSIRYITGDFKDIGIKEYVVRHLTHNYHVNEFMAVDGVSFELESGDMLGIIGTNGAGKSTLLKAVAGIMEPTHGKITTEGEVAALLELGSGFDGDLTVKENAYLRGAMLGYTKAFMDETYNQIIDFAELREFEDRPFKQLSSGMKSRLAFSIASLVKPDILILDEVLSVGDGAFQEKSAKKMREIISQGATTILVSHSLNQIRELCNKVLWLDHGRQVAFGETEEICNIYEKYLQGNIVDLSQLCIQSYHQEPAGGKFEADNVRMISVNAIKKQPKVSFYIIIIAICMLLCGILFSSFMHCNEMLEVFITPTVETGDIIFRGASVDNVWYNPFEVVDTSDGWLYDSQKCVYVAKKNLPLKLHLPEGNDKSITFNVGPTCGNIIISNGKNENRINLSDYEELPMGKSIELFADLNPLKVNQDVLGALVIVAIFILMLMVCVTGHKDLRTNKTTRNGSIEFLRFVIIIGVVVHHYCGLAPHGYLGVDFFFVLSGVFLMRDFMRRENIAMSAEKKAVEYTKLRYCKILPYYLFAAGLSLVIDIAMRNNVTIGSLIKNNIWELLMLEGFGITDNILVGPGWYCSSLLIAGFVVYFLLSKSKGLYINLIAPFAVMITFVYMYQQFGNLNRWLQVDTIISTGTIRGFAELGLGCICADIVSRIKPLIQDRFAIISSIIEISSIIFLLCIIYRDNMAGYDFICVFFMVIVIGSFLVGNSILSKILNNKFSVYLGKISIAIYLNHAILAKINWYELLGLSWKQSFCVYMGGTILFSCISIEVVNLVVNNINKKKRCLKG